MVFLNGKFMPIEEARVPVLDRGFIFGDGVYELVPVYSRVPFRMDEHLARLERSLAAVRIRNPYSRAEWRDIILQLVAKQAFEDQGVYFQVTRGVAKRDHAFPKDAAPTVFIMSNPLVNPPQELVERGAAAVTRDRRPLACTATSSRSRSSATACCARSRPRWARRRRSCSATASSPRPRPRTCSWCRGGVILSPPKSNLILPGITYDVVVELAQAAGLPLEFRDVTRSRGARGGRALGDVVVQGSARDRDAGRQAGRRRQARARVFRRMHALYQEFKQKVMRAGKERQAA